VKRVQRRQTRVFCQPRLPYGKRVHYLSVSENILKKQHGMVKWLAARRWLLVTVVDRLKSSRNGKSFPPTVSFCLSSLGYRLFRSPRSEPSFNHWPILSTVGEIVCILLVLSTIHNAYRPTPECASKPDLPEAQIQPPTFSTMSIDHGNTFYWPVVDRTIKPWPGDINLHASSVMPINANLVY
jgi:hypothetical protein